jgi:hypothetical protein
MSAPLSYRHYSNGHPWYYVLGGEPLMPKQILGEVRAEGYRGYNRAEIELAASRCEPRRSQDLRALRAVAFKRLRFDLSGYRRAVRNLRKHRTECDAVECHDVHVSIGLKMSHLYNEFAHLIWIDELLTHQLDLFDC